MAIAFSSLPTELAKYENPLYSLLNPLSLRLFFPIKLPIDSSVKEESKYFKSASFFKLGINGGSIFFV